MRRKSLLFVLFAVLAVSVPAIAAWCSGSGPGWFMECSENSCTYSVQGADGRWRYYDMSRSQGQVLCAPN